MKKPPRPERSFERRLMPSEVQDGLAAGFLPMPADDALIQVAARDFLRHEPTPSLEIAMGRGFIRLTRENGQLRYGPSMRAVSCMGNVDVQDILECVDEELLFGRWKMRGLDGPGCNLVVPDTEEIDEEDVDILGPEGIRWCHTHAAPGAATAAACSEAVAQALATTRARQGGIHPSNRAMAGES